MFYMEHALKSFLCIKNLAAPFFIEIEFIKHKFTIFNHLNIQNSVVFSIVTMLYNYHDYLIPEKFSPPKEKLHTYSKQPLPT